MYNTEEQQLVQEFCDEYFWLRLVYNDYKVLISDSSTHELLDNTAPAFFQHFSKIISDYLLLQFCKVTDPFKMKNDHNLTAEYIVKRITWPPNTKKQLDELLKELNGFRKLIDKARHKIIVHKDVKVLLSNKVLGAFPKGKDEEFLDLLGKFCDLIHRDCFGGPYGDISTGSKGDVYDLIKTLKKSIAYDELLSENTGEQLIDLYNRLK